MGDVKPSTEPIAVVGLSLRLPGGADDLDRLWELLESGKSAWTPVPASRYNGDSFYHPNADNPNGTSNHPGGHFISGDVRDFDHAFFKFTKAQAATTDPQQRLLLELAYEALESGGIPQETLAGTATSVHTAIFPMDYDRYLSRDPLDLPMNYMTGTEKTMLSNRLSHVLDLRGPSVTIDSACSGGLVGLHQACQGLRAGESDTALVTASNLMLGPDHGIGLSNLHMLSSTGRCYPFDERGKGYGRGEGIVVLVLKRLSDAIRDRNPIRAVVRGSAIGHDGYTARGITYPNGKAQADIARAAYSSAGLRLEDVAYVEAHGTGTKAGDAEELAGVVDAFAGGSKARLAPLYVGSIKGTIGHTEAASGLASLVKAIAILDRGQIPPVAGFSKPKPGLPLDRIAIPTSLVPLPLTESIVPRVSVSSYGFGGALAHAIIERGPRPPEGIRSNTSSHRLFTLSAATPKSLEAMIQAHCNWIEQRPEIALADLSYTLLHRRSALPYRFSAVARDTGSLLHAFNHAIVPTRPAAADLDITFIFTGQGAEWAGMGRELLMDSAIQSSAFRDSIRMSRDILRKIGASFDLEAELLCNTRASRINEPGVAGPATTTLQLALVALLRTQGVNPQAVIGHSLGEIAAAYTAGYLSHETAIRIAFHHGVIAGAAEAQGLDVGTFADDYRSRLGSVDFEDGAGVEFYSSVSTDLKSSDFGADYWISNLTSTMRFNEAVQTLGKSRNRPSGRHHILLEIGPDKVLQGFVHQSLEQLGMPNFSFDYYGTLERNIDAIVSALATSGKLFERGLRVNWDAVSTLMPDADTAVVQHDLPPYSWDHSTKHWYESRIGRAHRLRKEAYHDLLGVPALDATDLEPRWRHLISKATLPWLADHLVDGLSVFPVSGYVCMAVEGVLQLARQRHPQRAVEAVAIRDIAFTRRLFVPDGQRVELQLSFKPNSGSELGFAFTVSSLANDDVWHEHATGIIEAVFGEEDATSDTFGGELPRICSQNFTTPKGVLYKDMEAAGYKYGPAFAGLQSMTIAADMSQAAASFNVLDLQESMPYKHQSPHITHPSTLETILQTAWPLVLKRLYPGSITPVQVDEILISAQSPHLREPGSLLDVSTRLASVNLGTAVSDVYVGADGQKCLCVTGMEFRSQKGDPRSAAKTSADDTGRMAGYDLAWCKDIRYVRNGDLGPKPDLMTIIAQLATKRHGLAVLGLGVSPDLFERSLKKLRECGNEVLLSDFVDTSPGRFNDAVKRLKGFPVQFRTIRPGTSPTVRGFVTGQHDLVLASSSKWLAHAAEFVKPDGTVLLTLAAHEAETGSWRPSLEGTPVPLEEQLTLRDQALDKVVVVAKRANERWPGHVHILTHSVAASETQTPAYVSAIEKSLLANHVLVSRGRLDSSTVEGLLSKGITADTADDVILVIDDKPDSTVIADSVSFDGVTKLLTQPVRMAWLGLEDALRFQQMVRFARAGHAQNDSLRLTTINTTTSQSLEDDHDGYRRLVEVLVGAVSHLSNREIPHMEREYRIRSDGAVLVPRFRYSDALNRQGPKTEKHAFADAQRPLVLSSSSSSSSFSSPPLGGSSSSGLFVDNEELYDAPLAEDAIEVEVRSFVLSRVRRGSTSVGAYAGVVVTLGAEAKSFFSLGDHVVVPALAMGASRLRVPCEHAGRVPPGLPSTTAASLLLDSMAAAYALCCLPQLRPRLGTILIHGGHTSVGRAVIAVARSIGLDFMVTARDAAESRLLSHQLGIKGERMLITRRSLHSRDSGQILADGFDAVIQAGEDAVPSAILSRIRPFGAAMVLNRASPAFALGWGGGLPSNVALYHVDISDVVKDRSDLSASLVSKASAALDLVPLTGLELHVLEVGESAEAVRLISTGECDKIAMRVDPDSAVEVVAPGGRGSDLWASPQATFVIAGDLGDVGRGFLVLVAQRGATHLAAISRSVEDLESILALQEEMDAIRPGIRLYTVQCDVSLGSSLKAAAVELSRQGAPPVHGVIQVATMRKDPSLAQNTFDDFCSITRRNASGTANLHTVFTTSDLAFFLLLSSAAGIVHPGTEASHGTPSVLQNTLAFRGKPQQEKLQVIVGKTRFLAVDIGWIEDEVFTGNDETQQNALRRPDPTLVQAEELSRFSDRILNIIAASSDELELSQAVIGIGAEYMAGAAAPNSSIHSALFSQIRHGRDGAGSAAEDSSGPTFAKVVARGDGEAVIDFISRATVAKLAQLLSIDAAGIDVHGGSILNIGLESMVVVELCTWIMQQFGAPLRSSEVMSDQSVYTLAKKIWTRRKETDSVGT